MYLYSMKTGKEKIETTIKDIETIINFWPNVGPMIEANGDGDELLRGWQFFLEKVESFAKREDKIKIGTIVLSPAEAGRILAVILATREHLKDVATIISEPVMVMWRFWCREIEASQKKCEAVIGEEFSQSERQDEKDSVFAEFYRSFGEYSRRFGLSLLEIYPELKAMPGRPKLLKLPAYKEPLGWYSPAGKYIIVPGNNFATGVLKILLPAGQTLCHRGGVCAVAK